MFDDYLYISQDNPAAADAFVLDMEARLRSIGELGLTGRSRDDLKLGLRSISYRERIVFFVIDDLHVTVMRILHSHQNITADDFTESED